MDDTGNEVKAVAPWYERKAEIAERSVDLSILQSGAHARPEDISDPSSKGGINEKAYT